jgi:predicted transcriptional regulator
LKKTNKNRIHLLSGHKISEEDIVNSDMMNLLYAISVKPKTDTLAELLMGIHKEIGLDQEYIAKLVKYLYKQKLLSKPVNGEYEITEAGRDLIHEITRRQKNSSPKEIIN